MAKKDSAGFRRRCLDAGCRRPAIRHNEDPQRQGERTSLDRPAAQGLHQSDSCSTAL
jgi:hypothetical protein